MVDLVVSFFLVFDDLTVQFLQQHVDRLAHIMVLRQRGEKVTFDMDASLSDSIHVFNFENELSIYQSIKVLLKLAYFSMYMVF